MRQQLVLSLHALVKSFFVFHISPLHMLKGHNKVSLEPSLLQAEQHQLSQHFLIPLIVFMVLFGSLLAGPCLSGDSRAGFSTPGEVL